MSFAAKWSGQSRVDPKCWLCAEVTKPKPGYQPNICESCFPTYKERSFCFVRASQQVIDELFPIPERHRND